MLEAEDFIAKSDWKAAAAKLAAWLAEHPSDARALFDAGYVADAQNQARRCRSLLPPCDRGGPKSFEAHLSLGLLLARQGKQRTRATGARRRHAARPRRRPDHS